MMLSYLLLERMPTMNLKLIPTVPSMKYFLFGKNRTKVEDMIKYQNLVLIKRGEGDFTVWVIGHIPEDHV